MKKFKYLISTQEFDEYITDEALYKYFDDNGISSEHRGDMSLKEFYMVNKINILGKGGWELVSVSDKKDKVVYYFKKEVM